ncbi:HD domain-containing protein [Patescibacteria group bacterium]|nr:HD domain-containing protein [Patescibacteria group bacterium]
MTKSTADISTLLERVANANSDFDIDRVVRAFRCAREVYGEESHRTGVNLYEHATGVLELLLPFEPDEDTIIASILHHVVSKDGLSLTELEERFGPTVRSLVSGVHLLASITIEGSRNSIDDLRLMLLSVSDDMRTILITLSDHCHLLDHAEGIGKDRVKRIASDVLRLYAPVASRLGIYNLKQELEKRAFPICYPSDAEHITGQIDRLRSQHGDFMENTASELKTYLLNNNLPVKIDWREKQPYSIFRKLNTKGLSSIEDVYDLFAIRVIVDRTDECYQTLGLIHKLGRPMANRFKDFIAFPKPNGYQSLHTTLLQLPQVPSDIFVEVQVRTKKMHHEAQYGVAAHWSYKEYGATHHAMEQTQLRKMLSMQESVHGEVESESTLADQIYVLTPKGDIVELPEGSTPLDFAFQVHTDLGLSFRSARVNGSIVPLNHELENGDVIDILKYRTPRPSPQWMQLLKISSSRSKLKRHLYLQRRSEFITKGREKVNTELTKHSLPSLDSDLSIMRVYDGDVLPFARREDLLMKVGQGSQNAASIFPHLEALRSHDFSKSKPRNRTIPKQQRKNNLVELEGGLPMPTRFAKGCKPDDGKREEIVGVINRSGEVVIHRSGCKMLKRANPERKIKALWK